jgi:hypothetical protein
MVQSKHTERNDRVGVGCDVALMIGEALTKLSSGKFPNIVIELTTGYIELSLGDVLKSVGLTHALINSMFCTAYPPPKKVRHIKCLR